MSRENPPTGLEMTVLDETFRNRPHERFDALRAADPVHHDTMLGRVLLTRAADVAAVLKDRTLSVDQRNAAPDSIVQRLFNEQDRDAPRSMLVLDDPDHGRLRRLVTHAFNVRAIEAMKPEVARIADELLDAVAGEAEFDIIESYASPLPIIVIAEMLGVDRADRGDFRRWSKGLANVFSPMRTPELLAQLKANGDELTAYFERAVADRRARPRDDLISAMVAVEEAGDRLTSTEIVTMCNLLLIAGNLTTTDLIGNCVLALLQHPGELAKVLANPARIPDAIEETLRRDPPVVQSARIPLDRCGDRRRAGAGDFVHDDLPDGGRPGPGAPCRAAEIRHRPARQDAFRLWRRRRTSASAPRSPAPKPRSRWNGCLPASPASASPAGRSSATSRRRSTACRNCGSGRDGSAARRTERTAADEVTALMGDAFALLVFLLAAGIVYVILRLTLGPGSYRIIVDMIANSLFVIVFCGGFSLVFLFAARSEPVGPMIWLGVIVFACFAMVGLWMLWLSAYALWFWRRPLVEVDNDGVRLLALAYRQVPWSEIAGRREPLRQHGTACVVCAVFGGRREQLGYMPRSAALVAVGWGRELPEITAAADVIRKHPNYRERAAAP